MRSARLEVFHSTRHGTDRDGECICVVLSFPSCATFLGTEIVDGVVADHVAGCAGEEAVPAKGSFDEDGDHVPDRESCRCGKEVFWCGVLRHAVPRDREGKEGEKEEFGPLLA